MTLPLQTISDKIHALTHKPGVACIPQGWLTHMDFTKTGPVSNEWVCPSHENILCPSNRSSSGLCACFSVQAHVSCVQSESSMSSISLCQKHVLIAYVLFKPTKSCRREWESVLVRDRQRKGSRAKQQETDAWRQGGEREQTGQREIGKTYW